MIPSSPNCTDIFEAHLISVEQALERILSSLPTLTDYQIINIEQAKGRTLLQAIVAPFNVPYQRNAAVDGYAFHATDIPTIGLTELSIVDTAYAGKPCITRIKRGQCIRIMTGAAIPEGLDVVAMQEHITLNQHTILINNQHHQGQNIRLAGEDIAQNETILQAGKFITPADIGLLASIGLAEIKVTRPLKIVIVSTGNEIMNLTNSHCAHKIYDSNRYILASALDRPDITITHLGILDDKPNALLNAFKQSSLYADIIISSGGVSVGDADYTKQAIEQAGNIDFWKIAIKPGRPFAFGKIGNSLFFGLPGNPVAVMVTFYQLVLPAIEQMLGIKNKPIAPKIEAKTTENIAKKTGRTEVVRGIIHQDKQGVWRAKTTGKQGSGILRSMSLANAFIILEHARGAVKTGETVTVQPFSALF